MLFQEIDLDEKRIVDLYEGGASMEKIADSIGCSTDAIRRRLVKNGVKIRRTGKNSPVVKKLDRNVNKAIRMYEYGYSLQEIGEAFGVASATVRKRLLKAGVSMRRKGIRPLAYRLRDLPKVR